MPHTNPQRVVSALLAETGADDGATRTFTLGPSGIMVRYYPMSTLRAGLSVDDLVQGEKTCRARLATVGLNPSSVTVEAAWQRVGLVFYCPVRRENAEQLVAALRADGFKESR